MIDGEIIGCEDGTALGLVEGVVVIGLAVGKHVGVLLVTIDGVIV